MMGFHTDFKLKTIGISNFKVSVNDNCRLSISPAHSPLLLTPTHLFYKNINSHCARRSIRRALQAQDRSLTEV